MADQTTTGLRFRGLDATFAGGVIIAGDEDRITAQGGSMYLGGGNGSTSLVQLSADLIPDADSSHDLGLTNRYWRKAYIDNITAGHTSIGASNNYVLDVKKAYSSTNGHVAYFGAGTNTASKVGYDTVVVAQDDVTCLAIVEGNAANTNASEQALRLAVGDNSAVISSTSTASNGMYFYTNRATSTYGYQINAGTRALHLANNGAATFAGAISSGDLTTTHTGGGTINIRRDDTSISDGDVIGVLNFQGDDPTDGTFNTGAAIRAEADGTWQSGQYATELRFQTRASGASLTTALTLNEDQSATFAGNVSVNEAGQKAVLHVKNEGNNWEDGVLLEHDSGDTGWNIHPENNSDNALWFGYNSDTSVALTSQGATAALKLNSDLSATFGGDVRIPQGAFVASQTSLTNPVLRLTNTGVNDYNFTFPNNSTIQLGSSVGTDLIFKLVNAGAGNFNLDVGGTGSFSQGQRHLTMDGMNSGSVAWRRLGTWHAGQSGQMLKVRLIGGSGYNASVGQQAELVIILRTSNASSTQTATQGAAVKFSGYFYREGYSSLTNYSSGVTNPIRVEVSATDQYTIYMHTSTFVGNTPIVVDTNSAAHFVVHADTGGSSADFSSSNYLELADNYRVVSDTYFSNTVHMVDSKAIKWGAENILSHNGTTTYLGDNTSASALSLTGGGNATFEGTITSSDLATFNNGITLGGSNETLKLLYNNTANYRGNLGWAYLQLGNNGSNDLVAGNTGAGGKFRFFVNNTNDIAGDGNPNGTLALTLESTGDATFESNVTVGDETVTSSTTNHENILIVKGKNNYSDGTNWYGTYGQILLHSDTNMTGSARRFLITNALGNNAFAIVRSVDGNTTPVVNSTAGGYTPSSGTVDFAISNTGNVGIGQAQPSYKLHVVGNSLVTGNATVNGSLIGKSDHTTELGSYADGQIKRIRMSQGGEVIFGDSSTANPIGVTEGVWNSFSDQDYMSIYSRNSFRIYGYGTSATPQLHTFVGRHTSSGGSFLGVGNITAPNGTYGTSNTILTVKGTTSGGEGIIQIVGLGNNATDNVGCLAFHSYAEADPMASIRSIRGNADDKGSLSFNTNNGGTEAERMRITSAGFVGIGTTNPGSKLEVKTSGSNSVVELDNSDTNYTVTQYNAQGVTKGFSGFNTSFMLFGGESGTDTRLQAGGQYGLTIRNSDRNVGIGTTDPEYKLEVNDATANGRAIQAVQTATSGTNYGFQGGAYGSGATKNIGLHITAEGATTNVAGVFVGDVGIATNSPNTKLDVNSGISSSSANVISISQNTNGAIKQAAAFGVAIQNGGESTNAADLTISTATGGSLYERMRVLTGGYVAIGQTTAYAPTGGGSTMLTVTRTANEETNLVVSNQANHASAEARLIMATYGHDFIISGTSSLGGSKLLFHRAAQKLLEFNSSNEAHFTGDVAIPSDQQLQIGSSISAGDLKIYRDTSSNTNLIVNKTGALKINQQQNDGNIVFTNDDGNGGSFDYFSLDGGSATYASGATTAAYTVWPDNSRIALGSGKDLQLWHDGTTSTIYNVTGNLHFTCWTDDSDIRFYGHDLSSGVTEYMRIDGGIGETVFSRNTQHLDQVHAQFGTGNDLKMYHDGSNSYIKDANANSDLIIQSNHILLQAPSGENMIFCNEDAEVKLYHNNASRIETSQGGMTVRGKITMDVDSITGGNYGFDLQGGVNDKLALSTLGTVQNFTKGGSTGPSGEGIFSYKNFRDYPSADDNSKVLNIAATSGKWGSTSHAASYIRFSTAEADTDTTQCLLLKPDNSAEFAGNVVVAQDKQLQASRNTTTSGVAAAAASFIDHTTGSGNRCTVAMEANGYQGSRHIEFYGGSNLHGSISAGYNATGFNTSSDYRLKENVNDLSGALAKVDLLLPKTFTWKGGDENRVVQGFLAHEAQEVVPESVTGTKDETDENGKAVYQGIDQAKLVPLLTAAIKELKAQNEDLLNRVKALESK